jgi:hypothetical protein
MREKKFKKHGHRGIGSMLNNTINVGYTGGSGAETPFAGFGSRLPSPICEE